MAARSGSYDHERFRRQLERETARERAQREREAEKVAKEEYLLSRQREASELNEECAVAWAELDELLKAALTQPVAPIDLRKLKLPPAVLELNLGDDIDPQVRPVWRTFEPTRPGALGKLFGGAARHEEAVTRARKKFKKAVETYEHKEAARQRRVADAMEGHARRQAAMDLEVAEANSAVDNTITGISARDRHAVSDYYQRVLDAQGDPPDFSRHRRSAYVPESDLLVIEWDLPSMSIVPERRAFKYVKSQDEITSRPIPATERRGLYQRLIAQLALRALRLAFHSDPASLVDTIVFNGMIDSVNPATGLDVRECLITLRATRDQFEPLRLDRIRPVPCIIEHFAADISEHPEELRAVEPVLVFDMADPRVVDPIDVLSEIDRRPNLLDYTPTEFEHFIQNLFAKMGLEVQVFRPGGDAGIDCVVYDRRAIFGGKFCVQAKLYRHTVPPSAVRDLFGAVGHEGATKGILITTSGFSKATYNWAKGKPLQLIDGTGLLSICSSHNIPARILQ